MSQIIDNDLLSIQEARILAEDAAQAQATLRSFSQKALDRIVEAVAGELEKYDYGLAVMSAEETGYGCWKDKQLKNRFVCQRVREALRNMACVGIVGKDEYQRTMDVGVPRGPIAALCPATSPVSTTIYKSLIAIKAGCSIVFSPHPKAIRTMGRTLDLIIETAEKNGLPRGAVSYMHTVASAGTEALLNHKEISLIMITGVPGMLKAAAATGKALIYGGTGNGPAFIERTADISQAVKDIVLSKSFDNGAMTAAEQSVVVDAPISDKVKTAFQAAGAYFMTEDEAETLGQLVFRLDGSLNEEMVGRSAIDLAKAAHFMVPKDTVLLVSEQKYVSQKNPYSREKLCPVLAYYVEDDWEHACEKCIELLLNERQGHTLVIHSQDEDVIEQFALRKPVARMLVNTPGSLGGIGVTTNLFPAMTLGSGSMGQGMTTDNVSPLNLVYIRKVGYGVRGLEESFSRGPVDFLAKADSFETIKGRILNSLDKSFLYRNY